jgi:hypothetical protein
MPIKQVWQVKDVQNEITKKLKLKRIKNLDLR